MISVNLNSEDQIEEQLCVSRIYSIKLKSYKWKLLWENHILLRSLNAERLRQQGTLEGLIHHDEGFKFLRALRGSPPYFEKAKKDLFAMIRQLCPASLFCSFSSANTMGSLTYILTTKYVNF